MHESVGKTQTVICALDPARAAALHTVLDRPGAPPGAGDALPSFWHQIYFWDPQRPAVLGRDGHPATGSGLIPNLGLPQRMWAGGRLQFHGEVQLGVSAEMTSTVESVTEKTGRSGRLGFVTLRHEIVQDGMLCVTEHQDLVYREPPDKRTAVPPKPAPDGEALSLEVPFSPVLLFRYSALTMNGHRIHYDADYARGVEGYSGIVVHGPLLAQMMIMLIEDLLGPLRSFEFRGLSPLSVDETAVVCLGTEDDIWVRGPDGRLCMEARFTRVHQNIPLDLDGQLHFY